MPIQELSDARRIGRDFKVRLGVRWRRVAGRREDVGRTDDMRDTYPRETDYFVIDEAPEDVRQAYGEAPKSLRVMLYAEWDSRDPEVFSLFNRAYGATKGLRCKGTGRSAESPGSATTDSREWALRIEQATQEAPEPIPSVTGTTMYKVRCLGRDCPKYLHMTEQPDPQDPSKTKQLLAVGHDRDASCKAVGILSCFLLDPGTNPEDRAHYCKPLGRMELATGSINSIIDLQSDFDLVLRAFTGGRTAGIPVTLIRRPTTTYRPVKQVHHTCAVRFDAAEVQRWAAIPLHEVFLGDAQRAALKRLAATPLGLTVDSVRGLLPDRLLPEAGDGQGGATEGVVIDQAPEGAAAVSEVPGAQAQASEPGPFVVQSQLDELKTLAGGPEDRARPYAPVTNPWRKAALERLYGVVKAMCAEEGLEPITRLNHLRVEHLPWLRARLLALPPVEDPS